MVVPGAPLHLIQRGSNRSATFYSTEDFEGYRETLREADHVYECAIHAYVLMSNHVHVLITPADVRGPARMMQAVGRRYVRYVNERYGRTGTLWEGRYKSTLIDSERYLLACSRYIELNPVRARMVDHPDAYRWSSHRHNAHGTPDPLITPHSCYHALASTTPDRQSAYRALFLDSLETRTLDTIRSATNRGTVLGSAGFRRHIEAALQRPVTRWPHGGDRRGDGYRARDFSRTLTP